MAEPLGPNCGRRMMDSQTLKPSVDGHEAVNVYKCGYCDVSFTTNDEEQIFGPHRVS